MAKPTTPNIDLPIRVENGDLALNEMDSVSDYKTKAEVVLRYRPGIRPDLPEFGSPSLLGQRLPLDTSEIQRALTEWIPETNYRVTESGGPGDPTERRVQVEVDEPSVTT